MKRVLAFLLLLATGFVVLMLALDEEQTAKPSTPQQSSRQEPTRQDSAPSQIPLDQGGTQVGLSGGFTISRHRDVPRQGGGVLRQKVYELTCKDSAPFADGRHRLQDLRVQLFDQGKHAADLTATRALVELTSNAQKQRELRENRELELENAVLVSHPDGGLPPVRMELGLVRALVGEAAITLNTADDNQPVSVLVDGERGGELRGKGMRASFPRQRDADASSLQLTILREPSVRVQGLTLRGSGELRYEEMLRSGAATLALTEDVAAEVQPKEGGSDPLGGRLVVTGKRMFGWMQRTASSGDKRARGAALAWTALRLHGEPARVTTDTVDLQSPRITVEPGASGQIASITADGGESALVQRGERGATFRSSRPIRLHRTASSLAATHRAFGFPSHALGALAQMEVVVFDGPCAVDAQDGVALAADRGMHVFKPQNGVDTEAIAARAFGNVRVATGAAEERIEATGDSGFFLARTKKGDRLRLGNADGASQQSFDVRREGVRLRGTGAAEITRDADGEVVAVLRSKSGSLQAENGARGDSDYGAMRNAESIDVTIASGAVRSFVAEGSATELETEQDGKPMFAKASRIEQVTDAQWRLSGTRGAPAALRYRGGDGEISGEMTAPRIDVHRVTGRAVVVDAIEQGDERARIDAVAPMRTGSAKSNVKAAASRIRAMPFAAGSDLDLRRLFALPPGAYEAAVAPMRDPWLWAENSVTAEVDDEKGSMRLQAASLLARPSTRSLLIQGDASQSSLASLVRVENGKPTLSAKGARVRFADEGGERVSLLTTYLGDSRLVPPRVSFFSEGALGWMSGECNGEIEVVRDAVRFLGPVHAQSLREDQTPDPLGMDVDAAQLTMRRHKDTGELLAVDAGGGVTVRWRDLYAQSKKVELDLRWKRCIAEDPDGAQVRFGSGQSYVAQRIEANYETYTVRSYFGRLQQDPRTAAK